MPNEKFYYADKRFLGTISEVEHDGVLNTISGDIPVLKNQIIFKSLNDDHVVMNYDYFKDHYLQVKQAKEKPVKKQLSPFEEQMIQAYANYNGSELNQTEDEQYINGTSELSKNKAF